MQIRLVSFYFLIFFCIFEKFSDVLFGFSNILSKNLRTIYYFWFFAIQDFSDFTCNQSFPCTRRTIQNQTFAMFHTILFNYLLGISSRIESSSENLCKLFIHSTNTESRKVEVRLKKFFILLDFASHFDFFFCLL